MFYQHQLPLHIEYSDVIVFIFTEDRDPKKPREVLKSTFAEFIVQVDNTKTEITHLSCTNCPITFKKLGSLLDDESDMDPVRVGFCHHVCLRAVELSGVVMKIPHFGIRIV